MSLKNPVTPPGIDPGTVRLLTQCLNHYATPGPISRSYNPEIGSPNIDSACSKNEGGKKAHGNVVEEHFGKYSLGNDADVS